MAETKLEKDEEGVINAFRRLKSFGFGHIEVKVQNHKMVGIEHAEFHSVASK